MILSELIDYSTLKLIWWLLLGVLLIGFAATDGFDMGVGTLLPFVGQTDTERRVAINSIGATWEGNQVWFILGGGAIFAAWPPLLCHQLFRLLSGDVRRAGGDDPAPRIVQVPLQATRPVPGATAGTGLCSLAPSCRRWSSAWRSATSWKACPSPSTGT